MTDSQTLCFKAIISFVRDLEEAFGETNRPIKLYYKVLEQISFTHTSAIEKNTELFAKFTKRNMQGILKHDFNLFEVTKISYSDKAFIDLNYVLTMATQEHCRCIWEHLLTICAILHPSSDARAVLMSARTPDPDSKEMNVIHNMVQKIEQHVNIQGSENPMDVVNKIISSGALTDIMAELNTNIQNGDLDIQKMLASLGGSMGSLGGL